MGFFMNSRSMEKWPQCRFMEHRRTDMVWCFLDSRRIRRKPSQCPKESCSLGCLLKSPPGMALVSKDRNVLKTSRIPTKIAWCHNVFSETESENEFRPLDGRIDEFHPKATRTLFIGNLEKTTSYQQLLDIFQRFGEIVVRCHFI